MKRHEVEYKGITFDSRLECRYYVYLERMQQELGIKEIKVHPQYEGLPAYAKVCPKCYGKGKVSSPKTGKPIKCSHCKATGYKDVEATIFTPDFELIYEDGRREVIDVKGGFYGKSQKDKTFPIRKKIFEWRYGLHVYVVQWQDGKGWVMK
jgi:hypothetical protein